MRHLKALQVILVVAAVAGVQEVDAQIRGQVHEYAVPAHGKFSLRVPDGWQDFSKPMEQPASVLLRFRPATGDLFYVQVTSFWLDAAKLAKATRESLKATVTKSSEESLRQAIEKDVVLEELRGDETHGYYYSLTDRAPRPGEYKYLTQGSFLTGELMTVFTILYREPVFPEKEMILQMLADAKYAK